MSPQVIVGPDGPTSSPIVLIGEAPAKEEIFEGRPFVGSAGHYLTKLLDLSGLIRPDLYITNLSKERAPNDKMERMKLEDLKYWEEELIREINDLPNPRILVPLGAYALRAVSGKSGITNLRGSVFPPRQEIKHDCLVIPTLHPSNLHYHYEVWPLIVADLGKVRRIKENDFNFEWPKYDFILRPSLEQVEGILKMLLDEKPPVVVIDIENPQNILSAIGLGWSHSDAVCIPLMWGNGDSYWTMEQEFHLWRLLSEYLPKLHLSGQNVLFDWRIMEEHGIILQAPVWDSMLMHHCLYSDLPHTLDVIVSIYTDLPFYKKDEDEKKGSTLVNGRERDHWTYNCMDCIGTVWSIDELIIELNDEVIPEIIKCKR
uniref:Putative uracil DNA glycosylase superfamily protein n=1 Tax=viral metagenome TaxID=1070528 RepID=A0A6M3LAU6_9ZZZZ